jgi:hypothetical protein
MVGKVKGNKIMAIRRRKTQSKAATEKKVEKSKELAERYPAHPLGGDGKWALDKQGHWREGGASPRLWRPDLASLPSECVTKDASSEDQAHELDPPHIVEDVAYQHIKKEEEAAKPKQKTAKDLFKEYGAPIGEVVPLSQTRVDLVRFRIGAARLNYYLERLEMSENIDIDEKLHVWFPKNNVNEYYLRPGSAPLLGDSKERPPHLRYLHLEIDPLSPPKSIRDLMALEGIQFQDARFLLEQARAEAKKKPVNELLQAVIDGSTES